MDFIDLSLFKHRIHSDNISSKKRKVLLDDAISITKFYREKISFSNPALAQKIDKRITKYMFYKAIWSLNHTNRREALSQYFDCIKTGTFDYKIVLSSIFFIMPKFISAPLAKNLIKIQSG